MIQKIKTLVYAFLFLPLSLFAQDQTRIDSLNEAFKKQHHDTIKVKILAGIVWEYFYPQPEKAKAYAAQVVTLSQRSNYTKGVWEGYNMFGVLHYAYARYDSAIIWFNKAVQLSPDKEFNTQRIYSLTYAGHSYQKLTEFNKSDSCFLQILEIANAQKDITGMAKGHKALAINFYVKGEYLSALEHYLKADSLLGDELSIDKGEILQNIGITYHSIGNTKAEQQYYARALAVYEKTKNEYGVNAIKLSLGSLELENKNYAKAQDYLLASLAYFKEINDPAVSGEIQYLLGRCHYFLNQYPEAKTYFNAAIVSLKDTEGNMSLNHAYRALGELHDALNENDKAMLNYETAYTLAKKIGELPSIISILESKANLYYKTKEYKKAADIFKEHKILSDSVNAIKSAKVIHEIEAKYQNEKKEKEIELLSAENELALQQKNFQRNVFLLLIVFALALIAVLYFLFRTKQKANIKLQQLDTLKSHFFSNISHEFRTPLTLISGPVQHRLSDSSLSEHDRAEFEMINRNSKQLLGLVDQLLDLSKLEAGGMSLRIQLSDMSLWLKNVTASFQYLAETKQIQYQTDISDDHHPVWYDRDALQKIIGNLISNAFKYTPAHGTIQIIATIKDNHLFFSITNTGPGIPEADLSKIFDRFYQVNGGLGGIGIGLALVKELVNLHGGTITAQSTPGKQTEFQVNLPVSKEQLPHAAVIKMNPARISSPNLGEDVIVNGKDSHEAPVILLVEDNADIRTFVKTILSNNYTFLEAADGASGIQLALEHIPDLILSDVMMPDTDGLTLCRKLKTDERTSHVPIILLTAKAGDEDALLGYETGADDYITKPFNSDLLIARINALIEVRKKLHERFSQEVILKPKAIKLNSTDEIFLQKVQGVLEKNLTESSFNAERFAVEVGMSRMQLHRKLTGLTGLSANAFIRSNRLKMAAQLLTTSDVNMAEVGYLVGFNDPSYFAKCFKEQYHCTPTEYQKRHVSDQKL